MSGRLRVILMLIGLALACAVIVYAVVLSFQEIMAIF